jgi:ribonuclease HepT-like protein
MNEEVRDLNALIQDHRSRLEKIRGSVETALENEIGLLGKTSTSALIIAGLLENYYTCIETIFVRISQFFENNLEPGRWHTDLLQKMTLEVEGVRAAAVSKANFPALFELLKFRHFKRYYFDLEYDWDRLDFLIVKLNKAHPAAVQDLDCFLEFLRRI